MRAAFTLVAGVAAAALLTGCGNRPDAIAPLTASAIAIASPDGAIPVTSTMQFTAVVTDADGHTLTTTPTWSLVNGGGVITSGGLFTAGDSTGTFVNTIVATIGSVSAMSSITVSAGALANISIVPADDSVAVDATKQFTATGTDAFGHVAAIPAGLVWAVSSPTAGTVDSTGRFSAGSVLGPYTADPRHTRAACISAVHGRRQGRAQQRRRHHAGVDSDRRQRHDRWGRSLPLQCGRRNVHGRSYRHEWSGRGACHGHGESRSRRLCSGDAGEPGPPSEWNSAIPCDGAG
jgi:hypothetical protein